MSGARFKDLIAYQKAYSLVKKIYTLSKEFPREEIYGVVSQIRRAAVSIPSSMAEGYMQGTKEYVRLLKIALGSSAEVETRLSLNKDLGFSEARDIDRIFETNTEVSKLLVTYINRLTNKT